MSEYDRLMVSYQAALADIKHVVAENDHLRGTLYNIMKRARADNPALYQLCKKSLEREGSDHGTERP